MEVDKEFLSELSGPFTLPQLNAVQPLPDYLKSVYLSCGTSLFIATIQVADAQLQALPFEKACQLAGFEPVEIAHAMQQHHAVRKALNRADAQNMLWWVEKIKRAAERDWKAAAMYLERTMPSIFAEVKAVTRREMPTISSAPTNAGKEIPVEELTDEELVRLAEGK